MAYIPGFEHDIFISYAHVDNATLSPNEKGWVDTFHGHLEMELARKIGRSGLIDIWLDRHDLDPNQRFDNEIADGVHSAAILVALYSNGYKASRYCLEGELKPFFEKAQEDNFGLVVGENRFRIYPLFLADIHHAEWPPEFEGVSGFPFYSSEDKEYSSTPGSEEFVKQIRKLASSLSKMLEEFKAHTASSTSSATPEDVAEAASEKGIDANAQTVFIADVPESLANTAQKLANDLEREGIQIIQRIPPPYTDKEHNEKIAELIPACAMSVHLLDQFPGRTIDGNPTQTYRQAQIEIIKDADLSQIIWVPKQIEIKSIEDEAYRAFLSDLQDGQRESDEIFEFVRILPTNLKSHVLNKLKQQKEKLEQQAVPANGETAGVLIDTHQKDQLHAFEFSKLLVEHKMQPYVNPLEDDPTANLSELESRLQKVKMLMVLYGSVGEDWVRQRLAEVLKLQVIKGLDIQEYCVLNVPPEKKGELNFNFGPTRVNLINFNAGNQAGEKDLKTVLNRVRGGVA